jgi:hypothetical protein
MGNLLVFQPDPEAHSYIHVRSICHLDMNVERAESRRDNNHAKYRLKTPTRAARGARGWMARELLSAGVMAFSHVVDRVRSHFTEMPGLELTMPQAVRLMGFGVDDCRYVIDALVDAGFLRWTARRTIVRTDATWAREAESSYVSVRRSGSPHRIVDRKR